MEKRRLTRKELVEHIRETMPSDYNEYEKLAFIEKEVAKQISFDEKYLWSNDETRRKIYSLAKRDAQRPSTDVKRKIICVNMAELFGYVAKQLGYDVRYQKRAPGYEIKSGENEIFEAISEEKTEHVCPIVGLSNGNFIEVDIQDDLARLQTHSKPKAFGCHRHGTKINNGVIIEILDKSIVENTFRKVYGLEENEKFTDEYIMVLAAKLRCEGKTPVEMLDVFMEDSKIKKELQNTKCIEAHKLYSAILKVSYDVPVGKKFFKDEHEAIIEECILSDAEGRKRYSFCIYAESTDQKVFYMYSKKSKRMIKLTREEMQQLTQQVMNVELGGCSSYLKNQIMSYVNGNEQSGISEKQTTSLEDIFIDDDEEELE